MCSKCPWINLQIDSQASLLYMTTYVSTAKHKNNTTSTYYNSWKQQLNKVWYFNSNKCHISQPQITFYGTIFSAQGIKPDPMKIQALQDLPTPQLQKQLQSFLGLVNYLQPFLPGIASKTTFLCKQISQWD